MREYEVTQACYIPVGTGFRYKLPGQRVRLAADDAAELGKLVVALPDRVQFLNTLASAAVDATESVQKLNTPKGSGKAQVEPSLADVDLGDEPITHTNIEAALAEGVVDASEPDAADERAATED